MENWQIFRVKWGLKKYIGQTINNGLDLNGMLSDMVYDDTLWPHLIHVIWPRSW